MKCGIKTKAAFAKAAQGALPKRIRYWFPANMRLPNLGANETRFAIQAIFRLAQLYIPIPFDRTAHQSDALIRMTIGEPEDFDEAGNTLAMADVISLRDPSPREIWWSPFVKWGEGPVGKTINPIPVGAHEVGHALGFGHNAKTGLMYPTIQPLVTTPTAQEMRVFWKEYPEWKPQ
jgi:hypothetical protein